ncbi:hypothetical protein FSP39_010866 [Pinctada imbricata]|uniref:Cation-transporting ATPase n=1 Tax=Pinctada imbricata TaxID=66713 RepID=A0AA89CC18_PINIB|nr:hypothetical protein FSP39_010866 [Pinctada imbricata]
MFFMHVHVYILFSGDNESKFTVGIPDMDPDKVYINPATEDQMSIEGFKGNKAKRILTYTGYFLTVGLMRLFFHWFPHLRDNYKRWFVAKVITMTRDGTMVKIVQPELRFSFSKRRGQFTSIQHIQDKKVSDNLLRYFVVKKMRYIWNAETSSFQKIERAIYGINCIAIHVTPVITLLFREALSPFYVFQAFSASVWFSDEYEIYAACIVFISIVSIAVSIYQTRAMQRALRNTIQSSTLVSVCRQNDVYEEIPSEDLVPGDVIELPRSGCIMQCDAVLLNGNCIVNESMLTGESVPVTKTPLPNPQQGAKNITFSMKEHSKHVLFCGTHVIQTRFYGNQKVRAVVVRTGFCTAKGELVRSILYPKPVDFKFERDTYIFVGILALIAGLGFIYTIVLEIHHGEDVSDIILHALDLITISVPPALPAALTVGIVFAQRRLRTHGIFCISPRSINVCGGINVVCFDKTGTLTEDGLMIQGVIPVKNSSFQDEITDPAFLDHGPLLVAMATCHSLTIIEGNISGDPLDLIMFNSIDWTLEEPGQEGSRFDMMVPTVVYPRKMLNGVATDHSDPGALTPEYGVVRQFTFSSSLQRMSVVVRKLDGQSFELYTKGAPEMIALLCNPDTVPADFSQLLSSYTQHGYRVIGVAWKSLPAKTNYVKVQRMQREQVEKGLTFLGLIVMENKLKLETNPVIAELRDANIRTVMVTGDNMLTAVSVARECGMVDPADRIIAVTAYKDVTDTPQLEFTYSEDIGRKVEEICTDKEDSVIHIEQDDEHKFHFALSGKSWAIIRQYYPDILPKICVRGTVFARMSPEQKGQLVEVLQQLGYYVGMCGDGANDCGALKMAHAGISLSQAEASVASPFTSNTANIKCVPDVIRGGRAALVTSYGIFKFMACYSLTQFVSVCMLYSLSASLTDGQFLFIDLFLLSTLSITFGRADPYPELAKEPPPVSLTSFFPILSLILQMGIQIAAQMICFLDIQRQDWFEPFVENPDDDYASYENVAVFSMSAYQYIILAVTFSKGAPYRKNMFTNYSFLVNVILCVLATVWVTIYPEPKGFADLLELKPPPYIPYRLIFLGVASANFFASIIIETYFLDNPFIRRKFRQLAARCIPITEEKYVTLEREMTEQGPQWPPVSPSPSNMANGYIRLDSVSSQDPFKRFHVLVRV